jgi:hypothetical protein
MRVDRSAAVALRSAPAALFRESVSDPWRCGRAQLPSGTEWTTALALLRQTVVQLADEISALAGGPSLLTWGHGRSTIPSMGTGTLPSPPSQRSAMAGSTGA